MATFTYPTPTASYNGGQPAIGRDVRDDLDEIRTFVVGKNLEGSNIQDDTVDLANLTATVLEALVPTGSLLAFSAATEPAGWLICDGREVSRITFAALNALMAAQTPAYPYDNGDGSTTFNLPDLRGRLPIGSNNAGLPNGVDGARTTRDLGDEEGSETKTLTSDGQLPSHDHAIGSHVHSIGNHTHGVGALGLLGAGPSPFDTGGTMTTLYGGDDVAVVSFGTGTPTADPTGTSSGDTGLRGSSDPFDVMNPVNTTNYIIKT